MLFETKLIVSIFRNIAMVSNALEQSGTYNRVAEARQPLPDVKVGHGNQAGMIIELTGEMED